MLWYTLFLESKIEKKMNDNAKVDKVGGGGGGRTWTEEVFT